MYDYFYRYVATQILTRGQESSGVRQVFAVESRTGCRNKATGESANPWHVDRKHLNPRKRVAALVGEIGYGTMGSRIVSA